MIKEGKQQQQLDKGLDRSWESMATYLNQIIAPIDDKISKGDAWVKIHQEFVKVEDITMDMSHWVRDTRYNCT